MTKLLITLAFLVLRSVKPRTPVLLFVLCVCLFSSAAFGQEAAPKPPPKVVRDQTVTVSGTSATYLRDELGRSEVEPRSKQFKMNIRFVRGRFSKKELAGGTVIQQQYDWEYYPEAAVTILFFQYPAGTFSSMSPKDASIEISKLFDADIERIKARKTSEKEIKIGPALGKEFDVLLKGNLMRVRTFTNKDVRYVLIAQPKTDDAGPLIERLFNSFEFVL